MPPTEVGAMIAHAREMMATEANGFGEKYESIAAEPPHQISGPNRRRAINKRNNRKATSIPICVLALPNYSVKFLVKRPITAHCCAAVTNAWTAVADESSLKENWSAAVVPSNI